MSDALPYDCWACLLDWMGPANQLCLVNTCKTLRHVGETEIRQRFRMYIEDAATEYSGATPIDSQILEKAREQTRSCPLGRLAHALREIRVSQLKPGYEAWFFSGVEPWLHVGELWMFDFLSSATPSWMAYFTGYSHHHFSPRIRAPLRLLWARDEYGERASTHDILHAMAEFTRRGWDINLDDVITCSITAILNRYLPHGDANLMGKPRIKQLLDEILEYNAVPAMTWLLGQLPSLTFDTKHQVAALFMSDEMASTVLGPAMGTLELPDSEVGPRLLAAPTATIFRVAQYIGADRVEEILATVRRPIALRRVVRARLRGPKAMDNVD